MRTHSFYLTILDSFLLGGCTQMDYNEPFASNQPVQNGKTDAKFDVGLTAAKAFVEILNKDTSGVLRKEVKKITPIVHKGDTLVYLVNYEENKGWLIVSGDKRTPGILAYSDKGSFETASLNPGQMTWLDDLANQIYVLKHQTNGVADTLAADYRLWNNIETYVANTSDSGPLHTITPLPEGSWILIDVQSETLSPTQVGPLLQTKWGQGSPWNTCVPTDAPNSTHRCPTGCTAVAGAQMLYYLHYKLGVPAAMYSTGSCIGWSNNVSSNNILDAISHFFSLSNAYEYSFSFSNSDTTTWNQMAKMKPFFVDADATTDRVAVLMGYVGWQIKTAYSGNGSSSTLDNLADFYSAQGIKCDSKGYNSSDVITGLRNNMPVIVRADSRMIEHGVLGIDFWTEYTDGHAWVIDGYENKNIKCTYTYEWSGGSNPPNILVNPPINTRKTEEEIITTPNYFYMNWGYDGHWDDGRYTFDGLWNANDGDHQYRREMIINFALK